MAGVCAPIMYYGGKGNMISKLLPLLPAGEVYVEPYCGAASLFFAKEPHRVEVLNDLNHDIYNLFSVFRDSTAFSEFRHLVMLTPYSYEHFLRASEVMRSVSPPAPNVERAWAFFVSQNQGFSGHPGNTSWGKTFMSRGHVASNVNKWLKRLALLDFFRWRLMMPQIDCRDALEVIRYWDSPKTVFYLDPPYVRATRSGREGYADYECSDDHHRALVELLLTIKGKAMISGYDHEIYAPLSQHWRKMAFSVPCYAVGRTRPTNLQGAGCLTEKHRRKEVVWIKE